MKYNPEQLDRFIEHLVLGIAPERALKLAGFSPTKNVKGQAAQVLEIPYVKETLLAYRDEMRKRFRITRDRAVEMLVEAYERAALMGNTRDMVAAVAELNKMHGHHEPKRIELELSGQTVRLTQQLQALSDQQLLEVIEGEVIEETSH